MSGGMKPNKIMLKRMVIVMITMVSIMSLVLATSLTLTMVVHGEKYQRMASEQQLYDSLISAPRGDIYDSKMNVLATSTTAWNVYITPNGIVKMSDETKKEAIRNLIADGLSEILEVDREKVYEDTGKNSYYVIVKKKIDKDTSDRVREFLSQNSKIGVGKYVGLDETTKRYYPNGSLASVVLGFVGDDDQGLAGIESYYDTSLTGKAGRVVAAKTAYGTNMPLTYELVEEAQKGNTVVLTIDKYIQYIVEKQLKQAVEDNLCSERGVAMVMNTKTGAIYAMAVTGDFDPNEPFTVSASDQAAVDALEGEERNQTLSALRNKQWRNKAISDTYEPGSVFKIVTAAAGLEENAITLNSTFTCTGHTQVAGQPYSCHKHSGHGTQTLVQAMSNSCNPAFISIGQLIGVDTFSKYFEAFGLTKVTGIDLPGETSSIYYSADKMGPVELASASFGQTMKITPLQMLTAAAASVNGGYLVQPHVVEKVMDSSGNVLQAASNSYRRQVISEETSNQMRVALEAVVNGGAKNAYVAGYRTGGKTGTSEKIDKMNATDQKGLYVGSYVGLAPITDPQVAVIVLLDEPHGSSIYGGTISAPVASAIFEEILPYLGFEPQYSEEELAKRAISVPDTTGQEVAEAKGMITTAGLIYRVVGNGEQVVSQLPKSGETLYAGGLVILYTESDEGEETGTVPDFSGMSVSEVNTAAAEAGINVEFSGNTLSSAETKAYKQSVRAGETVKTGTVVTVYFRDPTVVDMPTDDP